MYVKCYINDRGNLSFPEIQTKIKSSVHVVYYGMNIMQRQTVTFVIMMSLQHGTSSELICTQLEK
jgi:hypothetical protein